MSIEHTEGIVLKTYDYSDTSKIAVVFTKRFGKVKVIAKGARNQRSKMSAIVEPGSLVKMVFYMKPERELFQLSEAGLLDQFTAVRSDIEKFAYYMYILELVDSLFEHEEGDGCFFESLVSLIRAFSVSADAEMCVRAVEVAVLHALGHMLELTKCVECGREIPSALLTGAAYHAGGRVRFHENRKVFNYSFGHGGILCRSCAPAERNRAHCSHACAAAMAALLGADPGAVAALDPSFRQRAELKNILRKTLDFHLGKALKSLSFLDQVLVGRKP
ncbi:MAG TPA: DNA repair protein RecO [bacterium]|nr:DNA repair protein RecO [bacterium]